jgi:hypothetical protein
MYGLGGTRLEDGKCGIYNGECKTVCSERTALGVSDCIDAPSYDCVWLYGDAGLAIPKSAKCFEKVC